MHTILLHGQLGRGPVRLNARLPSVPPRLRSSAPCPAPVTRPTQMRRRPWGGRSPPFSARLPERAGPFAKQSAPPSESDGGAFLNG